VHRPGKQLQETGQKRQTPRNATDVTVDKKAKGRIVIDRERCKGCQLCFEVCPNHRIGAEMSLNKKGYLPAHFIEDAIEGRKECTGCAQCATVCPEVAIEVYRAK
jgi:2-oxoglutarate ferredoxin oxidoreductase subunit delta